MPCKKQFFKVIRTSPVITWAYVLKKPLKLKFVSTIFPQTYCSFVTNFCQLIISISELLKCLTLYKKPFSKLSTSDKK